MAISDDRQRIMPTKEDRLRGQRLDYPEAVILTHPENPQLKGEVLYIKITVHNEILLCFVKITIVF